RAELTAAGLDGEIWQCPVVLLADVRSVGVQGDGRTYGHPIVLRPVSSEDAMTADWTRLPYDVLSKISNRITNEVRDVNRVVLDVTSKPPGTIEWECPPAQTRDVPYVRVQSVRGCRSQGTSSTGSYVSRSDAAGHPSTQKARPR